MEERVMAYKIVSTSVSHIAHAGYKEDWQGKWHGSDGTYQVKPEWAKANSNFGRTASSDHYGYGNSTTATTPPPASKGGSTANNTNSSSGPTANANPTSTFKNSDYYRYQNAKNLTDEQLAEANLRAIRESNYNKNYPSRSEEFMKGAQQANQLVNQGAAFTKSLMPDKIYAAPLDLSNMTDEQLRAANNRAQLEMQYNQYFNPPKQNDAKKWVDIAATGMGLAISAAGVAVPIVIEVMRNKKKGG